MPVVVNLEDRSIPDVFFPEHLRLSAAAGNWPAYKHAVETVCRLKGVAGNLAVIRHYGPPDPRPEDIDEGRAREDWLAREELCKAIVTLNIKDFPAYGVPVGEGVHARTVWARLCEIHRPKRTCWSLMEWVRTPTWTERVLLFLLYLALFWVGRARLECEMRTPIRAASIGYYYRDLFHDYHSRSYKY